MLGLRSGHIIYRMRNRIQGLYYGMIFKIIRVVDIGTYIEFDIEYKSTFNLGFAPADDGTKYHVTFIATPNGVFLEPLRRYESLAESSTSSNIYPYSSKINANVGGHIAGTYRIWFYAEMTADIDNKHQSFVVRVDSTDYVSLQLHTHAAGKYPEYPNTPSGYFDIYLTAGTHLFEIRWGGEDAGKIYYIRNARISWARID